jgi:acyl carrier protein
MDKLLIKVSEIVEVSKDLVKSSSRFRIDFPDWDSLKGFAMIIMLEEEFNLKISFNDFLKLNTIEDIFKLISA